MRGFARELYHAARSLSKSPGFVVATVLFVAAGVGATTTIFSVVDTVLLRQLPYPDAGTLVHFRNGSHAYPSFNAWREMDSFESVVAARDYDVDLTGEGPPERIPATAVSGEFFRMLGGAPYLGRLFAPQDFPGDRSVAVLSHGFWTRLGADRSLIGRTIRLDGAETVVVGVLDPAFVPPYVETGNRVDVWFALDDGGERANAHGFSALGVLARLKSGVGLDAAQAEVDAQRAAIAEEVPSYRFRNGTLRTTPLETMHQATVGNVSSTLFMLLGAVGMLLLIACANVANLFLARGTSRTREIALRRALGANRLRIGGQVLVESVLLALVGGVLGVALAYVGVDLFGRFTPVEIPRLEGLAVDARVLWFSVVVSVATGVLFGTVPAVQAMRANVNDALKDGSAALTTNRAGTRVRSGLVVTEIALAVVLVAGAGLLLRSFVAMVQVDPGFDTERLVLLPLSLEAQYDEAERERFTRELIDGINALPGVESVAGGWSTPFANTGNHRCCWMDRVTGDPTLIDEDNPLQFFIHPVTAGYFETLKAPLALGREFNADDESAEAAVAILNRPAADALFGSDNPIGRTIQLYGQPITVIGVAEGVHHFGLSQAVEASIYLPYRQVGLGFPLFEVLVRTDDPMETIATGLRAAVWSVDPDLPIGTVTTIEARMSVSLATPRFYSGVLTVFAVVASLLACGGVYGSMLYTVGQRRREMGIRLALGAAGEDVMKLVLRYGAVLAVAGVGVGTLAGLVLSRVMKQLVWGVATTDPATFIGTAGLLGMTAVLAALQPAWQASRTDPLQTLKAD